MFLLFLGLRHVAVFELGVSFVGSEFSEHDMQMADLNHRGARVGAAFIVFTVPSITTVPSVAALDDPTDPYRLKSFGLFRRVVDLDFPLRAFVLQPSLELLVVIFVVPEDCLQAREVLRGHLRQDFGGGGAIVNVRPGHRHDEEQSQRVHDQMTLAALDFLTAIVAVVFTDWLSIHAALGVGSRPA